MVPAVFGSQSLSNNNVLFFSGRSTLERAIDFVSKFEEGGILESSGSSQPVALASLVGGILA